MPDIRWLRCDIKTIQLLPNVLAKQAAAERGAIEAIMIRDGVVTEGSHANVIGVVDGVMRTHPTNHLILPGITRAIVLDIARSLGIPCARSAFAERELHALEELFLAGRRPTSCRSCAWTTASRRRRARADHDAPARRIARAARRAASRGSARGRVDLALNRPDFLAESLEGDDHSPLLQIATRHPQATAALHRLWAYLTLGATRHRHRGSDAADRRAGGARPLPAALRRRCSGWPAEHGSPISGCTTSGAGAATGRGGAGRGFATFMFRAFKIVRRHPWRSSLAVRWAYGLRLTLPIACGAARVPLLVYVIGSAISCVTWSFVFTLFGWGFGRTTLIVLGHVRRYEKYLVAVDRSGVGDRVLGDAEAARRGRSRRSAGDGRHRPDPERRRRSGGR